jgi:hypothetical protein
VLVEVGSEFKEDFMSKPLTVGSKVMIPPLMPCGNCYYCIHYPLSANKCLTPVYYGRYLGFDKAPHLWGGWAEYVYVDLGTAGHRSPNCPMTCRCGSARCRALTSCIRAPSTAPPRWRIYLGRHRDPGFGPDRHSRWPPRWKWARRVISVGAPEAAAPAGAQSWREATVDIDQLRCRAHQSGARHRRRLWCRRGDGLLGTSDGGAGRHRIPA